MGCKAEHECRLNGSFASCEAGLAAATYVVTAKVCIELNDACKDVSSGTNTFLIEATRIEQVLRMRTSSETSLDMREQPVTIALRCIRNPTEVIRFKLVFENNKLVNELTILREGALISFRKSLELDGR